MDYRRIAEAMHAKRRADNDARILAIVGTPDDDTAINPLLAQDGRQDRYGRGARRPIGDTSPKRDTLATERANATNMKDENRISGALRIGARIDPLTGLTADLPNPN